MSNFLHVGFPKAASSFLQQHYFTQENNFHNLLEHGPHDWRRFIQHQLLSAQSSFYQSTPPPVPTSEFPGIRVGLSSEDIICSPIDYSLVLARWKEIFPDSRVLIISRSQPDLVFSWFVQYVRAGYFRNIGNFTSELIWDAQSSLWGALKFDRILELTRNYFHDVKLIPYELLKYDFRSFNCELNDFFEKEIVLQNVNVRPSLPDANLVLMRLLNGVWKHGFGLRLFLPQPSYNIGAGRDSVNQVRNPRINEKSIRRRRRIRIWSHRLTAAAESLRLSGKNDARHNFGNDYEALFIEHFSESNQALSDMINLDLEKLGYPMKR